MKIQDRSLKALAQKSNMTRQSPLYKPTGGIDVYAELLKYKQDKTNRLDGFQPYAINAYGEAIPRHFLGLGKLKDAGDWAWNKVIDPVINFGSDLGTGAITKGFSRPVYDDQGNLQADFSWRSAGSGLLDLGKRLSVLSTGGAAYLPLKLGEKAGLPSWMTSESFNDSNARRWVLAKQREQGLPDSYIQNPFQSGRDQRNLGRNQYWESNLPMGVKVAGSILADPTTYLAPGSIGKASAKLGLAGTRGGRLLLGGEKILEGEKAGQLTKASSRTARIAGGLFEGFDNPKAALVAATASGIGSELSSRTSNKWDDQILGFAAPALGGTGYSIGANQIARSRANMIADNNVPVFKTTSKTFEKAIADNKVPQAQAAQSWGNTLDKIGINKWERKFSGIDDFLASKKPTDKITADELKQHMIENQVDIEEKFIDKPKYVRYMQKEAIDSVSEIVKPLTISDFTIKEEDPWVSEGTGNVYKSTRYSFKLNPDEIYFTKNEREDGKASFWSIGNQYQYNWKSPEFKRENIDEVLWTINNLRLPEYPLVLSPKMRNYRELVLFQTGGKPLQGESIVKYTPDSFIKNREPSMRRQYADKETGQTLRETQYNYELNDGSGINIAYKEISKQDPDTGNAIVIPEKSKWQFTNHDLQTQEFNSLEEAVNAFNKHINNAMNQGWGESPHFHTNNTIAHVRMSDIDNRDTLYIGEIQSEFFQKMRKEHGQYYPFYENWQELIIKRLVRYAADNGYKAIKFSTGEKSLEVEGLRPRLFSGQKGRIIAYDNIKRKAEAIAKSNGFKIETSYPSGATSAFKNVFSNNDLYDYFNNLSDENLQEFNLSKTHVNEILEDARIAVKHKKLYNSEIDVNKELNKEVKTSLEDIFYKLRIDPDLPNSTLLPSEEAELNLFNHLLETGIATSPKNLPDEGLTLRLVPESIDKIINTEQSMRIAAGGQPQGGILDALEAEVARSIKGVKQPELMAANMVERVRQARKAERENRFRNLSQNEPISSMVDGNVQPELPGMPTADPMEAAGITPPERPMAGVGEGTPPPPPSRPFTEGSPEGEFTPRPEDSVTPELGTGDGSGTPPVPPTRPPSGMPEDMFPDEGMPTGGEGIDPIDYIDSPHGMPLYTSSAGDESGIVTTGRPGVAVMGPKGEETVDPATGVTVYRPTGEDGALERDAVIYRPMGEPVEGVVRATEIVGNLNKIDDVISEQKMLSEDDNKLQKAVKYLVAKTKINPSLLYNSTIGQIALGVIRQKERAHQLTQTTLASLDAMAGDYGTRPTIASGKKAMVGGKVFTLDDKGNINKIIRKSTGVPVEGIHWNDVFSHPEDFVLTKEQFAYIQQVHEILHGINLIREENGLKQYRFFRADGSSKMWVPRIVGAVDGVPVPKPTDHLLERVWESATEGVQNGVRYADPRDTVELFLKETYKEIADAQLYEALVKSGKTTDVSVFIPEKLRKINERMQNRIDSRLQRIGEIDKQIRALNATIPGMTPSKVREVKRQIGILNERKWGIYDTVDKYKAIQAKYYEEKIKPHEQKYQEGHKFKAMGDAFGGPRIPVAVTTWRSQSINLIKGTADVRVLKTEDADLLSKILVGEEYGGGRIYKLQEGAGNVSRQMAASTDFAAPFTQLLPLLFTDPIKWAKASALGYKSFLNPNTRAKYIRNNTKIINEMIAFGANPLTGEGWEAAGKGGEIPTAFRKTVGKVPVVSNVLSGGAKQTFGRFEAAYETALITARVEMWKSMRDGYARRNNLDGLAQYIRNMTGGMNSKELGVTRKQTQVESLWLAFSPKLLRSTISLFGMAVGGDIRFQKDAGARFGLSARNQEAWAARRALAKMAAFGTMTYIAVAEAKGQAEGKSQEEIWKEIQVGLNPTSGKKFMSIRIGNGWYGIGGQQRAVMQLLGTSIKAFTDDNYSAFADTDMRTNPILSWYSSRGAPGLNFASLTAEAGAKAFGGEVDVNPYVDINGPTDYLTAMGKTFVPFGVTSFIEGKATAEGFDQWGTTIAGAGGIRASMITPSEQRDDRVKAWGFTDEQGNKVEKFSELNKLQRQQFLEKFPIEKKEKEDGFTRMMAAYDKIEQDYIKEAKEWQILVDSGQRTRKDFAEWNKNRLQQKYAAQSQVEEMFKSVPADRSNFKGSITEYIQQRKLTPSDQAVADYYKLSDKFQLPGGQFNFEGLMDAREEFMAKLPANIRAYVQEVTKTKQSEVGIINDLNEAKTIVKPYFNAKDDIFKKNRRSSRFLMQFNSTNSLEDFISKKSTELGITPEALISVLEKKYPDFKKFNADVTEYRRVMRLRKPELDIALASWYGYSPANKQGYAIYMQTGSMRGYRNSNALIANKKLNSSTTATANALTLNRDNLSLSSLRSMPIE